MNIPEILLDDAQKSTGMGVTETIVEGLREIQERNKRRALAKLRGKIDFYLDLQKTLK